MKQPEGSFLNVFLNLQTDKFAPTEKFAPGQH
jgi:hypothetical protein